MGPCSSKKKKDNNKPLKKIPPRPQNKPIKTTLKQLKKKPGKKYTLPHDVKYFKGENMEEVDGKSFEDVQVVCLYFATSWCPACKKFTPLLIDIYKKINSEKK